MSPIYLYYCNDIKYPSELKTYHTHLKGGFFSLSKTGVDQDRVAADANSLYFFIILGYNISRKDKAQ